MADTKVKIDLKDAKMLKTVLRQAFPRDTASGARDIWAESNLLKNRDLGVADYLKLVGHLKFRGFIRASAEDPDYFWLTEDGGKYMNS